MQEPSLPPLPLPSTYSLLYSCCCCSRFLILQTIAKKGSLRSKLMARRLTSIKHRHIQALLLTEKSTRKTARKAECSERTIRRIRSNVRRFGATQPPPNKTGRHSSITACMRDALCNKLKKESWMYREEIVSYFRDEFNVEVSPSSVTQALQSIKWSKKVSRRVAKQRNSVLRHLYHYKLSKYKSYHLNLHR